MSQFTEWFSKQDGTKQFFGLEKEETNPYNKYIGHTAKPGMSRRKFAENIEATSGKEEQLIAEFYSEGGEVCGVNERNLCIEVSEGTFEIPRVFVKVLRD